MLKIDPAPTPSAIGEALSQRRRALQGANASRVEVSQLKRRMRRARAGARRRHPRPAARDLAASCSSTCCSGRRGVRRHDCARSTPARCATASVNLACDAGRAHRPPAPLAGRPDRASADDRRRPGWSSSTSATTSTPPSPATTAPATPARPSGASRPSRSSRCCSAAPAATIDDARRVGDPDRRRAAHHHPHRAA